MPSLVYPDKRIVADRYILSLNPVLYLPLWKRDGSVIPSEDAYGHSCTVTGALWTSQGRLFDAVDDVIHLSDDNLGLTSAFTVMLWARITGDGNILAIDSAGTIRTRLLQSGNNIAWAVQTPVAVTSNSTTTNLNKWYHIVGVYNGATQYILLNGVIEDSDAQTGSIGAGQTNLGAASNGGYTPMRADELAIFRRALSFLEIQNIYLATKWRYQ